MTQFLGPPLLQVYDASGGPRVGAKLHVYSPGTTTPLSLFSDDDLLTPTANPLVSDSAGIFPVAFMAETSCKIVLTDSADVVLHTRDPVFSIGQSDNIVAENVSFDGAGIGFSATNVQEAIEEIDTLFLKLSGGTVTGATEFTSTVTISSTDAGATASPDLDLYRNSASPADNDVLGKVTFNGEDDAGNKQEYASIQAVATDVSSTTEDAELEFRTVNAGTVATRAKLGQGLQIGSPTGGDKGSGTLNAAGTMYVNNSAVITAASFAAQYVTDAVYTGSSASNTTFPVGSHVILAEGTTSTPDRSESATLYLKSPATDAYGDTGSSALSGTWRCRGRIDNTDSYLMQRTA